MASQNVTFSVAPSVITNIAISLDDVVLMLTHDVFDLFRWTQDDTVRQRIVDLARVLPSKTCLPIVQ